MLNPKPKKCISQPWPQGAHSSAICTDQETNGCLPLGSEHARHTAGTAHAQRAPATRGAQSPAPKQSLPDRAFRADEEWEGLSERKAQQQETTWPAPGTAHSWASVRVRGPGGTAAERQGAGRPQGLVTGARGHSRPPPQCCMRAKHSGNELRADSHRSELHRGAASAAHSEHTLLTDGDKREGAEGSMG